MFLNWGLKKQIKITATGVSVLGISKSSLNEIRINLPSIPEQQKIATFLSKVDRKIEKLEEKRQFWSSYKRGTIQQIFNQELRFKDDNGDEYPDWEEKMLVNIAVFSKGKGISKNDVSKEGVECIRYGELYTIYKERIYDVISKTGLEIDDLVLSKENDVIIPTSGETAVDIAKASCVMRSGVAIGGDTTIIKTSENGLFISYYLNNSWKNIAKLAQGVSVVHLYSSHLKTLKLNIPSRPEQEKIVNFLSSIEKKLEQLNNELKINKEFKKGLLQQMLC